MYNIIMADTSYTPLDNPDLATFDPTTIGVDGGITTQAVNSKKTTIGTY